MHPSSRRRSGDGGFTLIESAAALALAAMLFVLVGGALSASLRSSRDSKLHETATALGTDRMELARSLPWEQLAMRSIDPSAPLLDDDATHLLLPQNDSMLTEELLVCPTGVLTPHWELVREGAHFDAWVYVTEVGPDLRRVVARVEWTLEGDSRTHQVSTLISPMTSVRAQTASEWSVEGAVIATDFITMGGGGGTSTVGGSSGAPVLGNTGFKDATAVIDGDLTVGGTATVDPAKVAGTVTQNAGAVVTMPPDDEIQALRAQLIADARSGTIRSGTVKYKDTTITAPLYVEGAIEFEETITVLGSGPIFATLGIKLKGGAIMNAEASVLASDGVIEFSGGSEYRVAQPSQGGLVSFAADKRALKLSGGSQGTTQGVAFAPYGGIELSGSAGWAGSLIAGGSDGRGEVKLSGGSTVFYQPGLATASLLLRGFGGEEPVSTCG